MPQKYKYKGREKEYHRERRKKYRIEHREEYNAKSREYRKRRIKKDLTFKEKLREWNKKGRENFRIKHPNYMKEYYEKHGKKYYEKNKTKKIEQRRKWRNALRMQIIELLGGKCSNPNCPVPPEKMDVRCLQIDHVYGGGTKEIKKMNRDNYMKMIFQKIKSGSKDYQLLCAYCNWLKELDKRQNNR